MHFLCLQKSLAMPGSQLSSVPHVLIVSRGCVIISTNIEPCGDFLRLRRKRAEMEMLAEVKEESKRAGNEETQAVDIMQADPDKRGGAERRLLAKVQGDIHQPSDTTLTLGSFIETGDAVQETSKGKASAKSTSEARALLKSQLKSLCLPMSMTRPGLTWRAGPWATPRRMRRASVTRFTSILVKARTRCLQRLEG